MLAPASGFLLAPGHTLSVQTARGGQVLVASGSLLYASGTAGSAFDYSVVWAAQPAATADVRVRR